MRPTVLSLSLMPIAVLGTVLLLPEPAKPPVTVASPGSYLGFDLNIYPGDAALPILRRTFSFGSYWLGASPGEKTSNWAGKRKVMEAQGFGLVVLYNGPLTKELKSPKQAAAKADYESKRAVELLKKEGFAKGTIVFLDIEEGGRLSSAFHTFLARWFDGITSEGYRAGVYCSGMPVPDGPNATIVTAEDIRANSAGRDWHYWVFNDRCPPSPGCVFPKDPPAPAASGTSDAAIWQFAQSPRRMEFTAGCPAGYHSDGKCYAPGDDAHRWEIDVNVATSPNPSQQ